MTPLPIPALSRRLSQHFHNRDWDNALLSCRPHLPGTRAVDALQLWYAPWNNASLQCRGAVALPSAFTGSWSDDHTSKISEHARHECGGLRSLARAGVAITTLDAERVFTRLMVNRTEPPNTAYLHTKAGFGKTRADGCVVGVNYSDPMAPLLKRIPAPKDSWPPAR